MLYDDTDRETIMHHIEDSVATLTMWLDALAMHECKARSPSKVHFIVTETRKVEILPRNLRLRCP